MFDPENTANQKYIYKQNPEAMEEEKVGMGNCVTRKEELFVYRYPLF